MDSIKFRALRIEETKGRYIKNIIERNTTDLPKGDVLIKVEYSSLNYKDALSASGNKGVTKEYPFTPGIDAAGVVESCKTNDFEKGDQVIVTGKDLGMNTDGGFGQYIRVPAQWVLPLPEGLSLKESMMYGTAGITAAASVYEITSNINADEGKVLVSGTSGGVGSLAAKILIKLGYDVTGIAGSEKSRDMVESIGVKNILSHEEASAGKDKPMLKTRWKAVSDNVGGDVLSYALKSTDYNGIVTTCGNIAGEKFDVWVYPFILRGIRLQGIGSSELPMIRKSMLLHKMAGDYRPQNLDAGIETIPLDELPAAIDDMLNGESKGRKVVKLW